MTFPERSTRMRFLGKALCQSLLFILLLTGTARGETSVYFAG